MNVAPEVCSPDTPRYGGEWPEGTVAQWTADAGVALDAAYLRAALVLLAPLRIVGMTLLRVFDDHDPFFFLFASAAGGSLILVDSDAGSDCGGRNPSYIAETLATSLPADVPYVVDNAASRISLASARLRLVDSLNAGTVQLQNVTVHCYDPTDLPDLPPQVLLFPLCRCQGMFS